MKAGYRTVGERDIAGFAAADGGLPLVQENLVAVHGVDQDPHRFVSRTVTDQGDGAAQHQDDGDRRQHNPPGGAQVVEHLRDIHSHGLLLPIWIYIFKHKAKWFKSQITAG